MRATDSGGDGEVLVLLQSGVFGVLRRRSPGTVSRLVNVVGFALTLCLAGCGGATESASPSAQNSTTASPNGAPVGLIAIGHSGLTGESSDLGRPRQNALENSWATGTNPEVNSIYLRLVAQRPETEGHVANAARGGAVASELVGQAQVALREVPTPALVIIQTIDNDIQCDGHDAQEIHDFGVAVSAALKTIAEASPQSRILIVGQPGRPLVEEIAAEAERDPQFKQEMTGPGECTFFSPDGEINQANIAALVHRIEGFEAEQARACAAISECATDKGVSATLSEIPEDRILGHLNVHGHARLSALFWPVVAELI